MLVHPQFDPVAIHLGPLAIRWYGLMYLAGFIMFLWFGRLRVRQPHNFLRGWTTRDLDDLLFYGVLGVILGGRLGYVLFYKPTYYLSHPLEIFKVWEGGMAFHGGFLGVLVAVWVFARLRGRSWFEVTDFIAPLIPCGLAAGRIGNFINGELWGRPTDLPWGMIFPQAGDNIPRHPSQLYQFAGEGVALFIILWFYSRKPRPTAAVSGLFLLGYGVFRFLAEYTREPDNFLGLLALNFSMGQWLSLPMILAGVIMMVWAYRRAGSRDAARA
ncbi:MULTISPECIES: prolipoprotein diacylglyceryl transferase [Cupriavidus]|uniref:Phosphatidylglycerol--prolipoprotein diacylglyceryl transferase n=1 Tax=Cupriavidus pauculus TaxID=82633 RepID=A0A5P2GZ56_9BURK|nr:prolipoprotein diacylglyceryl transferase [Cupriavidus pauculus]QET00784.1 prolipoprotein diacylglyceryl transferase [Cupriavidus pauculus]